eukprot:TRINITY_DN8186_c0_g2_i2.p1 TRINITY_DN8186_c0_g2~~TRINITY_DN8186_c0_g2_i2.p1  ORF type:complete len:521 (-),score=80.21 TRINITY_DN8186_c0_g2_i2:281-1801(-)
MSETKSCNFCFSDIPVKATICKFCSSQLSNFDSEENMGFTVVKRERADLDNNTNVTETWIIIKNQALIQILQSVSDDPIFMEKEPALISHDLLILLPSIRQYDNNDSYAHTALPGFIKYLELDFEEQVKKYDVMTKEGVITFELLQLLFVRGKKVFGLEGGELLGFDIVRTEYEKGMMGKFFMIEGEVIKSDGSKFFNMSYSFTIPQFRGVKPVTDLPVRPMTDDVYKTLVARGKTFSKIAQGSHYLTYKGPMLWKEKYHNTAWKADGRVMVDGSSFNRMNPSYPEFSRVSSSLWGHRNSLNENTQTIPEEFLYKTWPTIGGFSFTVKKWGEVIVSNTREVVYDENAFQRLVLAEEKKHLIQALVLHNDKTLSDIISGKGAGCIFLLHGPPGCGKTLTAEAISELIHRPLYSVSVGELGTDTDTLEVTLRDILDVASVWNAVVLIDEADIFLERRTEHDIVRNAMVGIFLRLLEYHQGILFLTTNRCGRTFYNLLKFRVSKKTLRN